MLEDDRKLNEYRITETDTLEARKPYIGVTVENNYGNKIYWRLDRKDTIKEVKVKLASAQSSLAASQGQFSFTSQGGGLDGKLENPVPEDINFPDGTVPWVKGETPIALSLGETTYAGNFSSGGPSSGSISAEATRLYLIIEDQVFEELDDDKTVEYQKIKNGDNLYLLTYRWTYNEGDVTVEETGKQLEGVEREDTILGIKLRIQDQLGIPVAVLKLFKAYSYNHEVTERKPFNEKRALSLVARTKHEIYR